MCIQADAELTAVRFDDSGLHCAVGTSNGLVALYDLRSSRPLLVKDHMYGDKITDIKFHSAHGSSGNSGTPCNYTYTIADVIVHNLCSKLPTHLASTTCANVTQTRLF